MDLATITTLAGLAMTIGGVCYQFGYRSSWAEKERLRGTIDTLTTENAGLKQQIENVKQMTELAERHNKFNVERWENAQREAAKTGEQLKTAEARLAKLEEQKAAGASQAEIDRGTLEIRSSLTSALAANNSTTAILSSGPVRLFIVGPSEEPKKNTP
jgi:chromosome segregation ATPase